MDIIEKIKNEICPVCRIHTPRKVIHLENERIKWICSECGYSSLIYDKDGNEVNEEKLKEERKDWQ